MSRHKPKRHRRVAGAGNTAARKSKFKMTRRQILIVGIMILALIGLIVPNIPTSKNEVPEPPFVKEGTLQFFNGNTGQEIETLDIEVAATRPEILQGLMYRKSMDESNGMLFLMGESKPQGFYMRNTYISLDIIFVNENFEIVKIHANTKPLDETSLPSGENAMYVVETVAGYCQKHKITEGDKIQFEVDSLQPATSDQ